MRAKIDVNLDDKAKNIAKSRKDKQNKVDSNKKKSKTEELRSKYAEYKNDLNDHHIFFLHNFKMLKCNVSKTCESVGRGRSWYYENRQNNKVFDTLCQDLQEELIDLVEDAFLENVIDRGNIIGQIFYLKTKAKNRGYTEKIETESTINIEDFEFEEV